LAPIRRSADPPIRSLVRPPGAPNEASQQTNGT